MYSRQVVAPVGATAFFHGRKRFPVLLKFIGKIINEPGGRQCLTDNVRTV